MKYYLPILIGFLSQLIPALQAQQSLSNAIPVARQNGQILSNAWAGGMNKPQFSAIDLNRDGIQDLVVFDGYGQFFTPYINEGTPGQTAYRYAPEFIAHFDSCECRQWALLEDYNCDGRMDIFCGIGNGQNIKVYENVLYPGDSVGFELAYEVVNVLTNNLRPIYNLPTDVPAIVDVDFDGDLDVISSQNLSNFFQYHINLSMERYGRCDTFDFEVGTNCWGHFYEFNANDSLILADTVFCPRTGDPTGGGLRHAGSTLLVLDLNGDSLMDALIGDVSFPTVNAAFNGGTRFHAFMDSAELRYPQYDVPINMGIFPASFYVDVDQDGKRDLIVAPNDNFLSENREGVVWYKNKGQDDFPDFQFQERGFLVKDQLDQGFRSHPLLFDYNVDGLPDLLLGSQFANEREADTTRTLYRMSLYENVGSLQSPKFQLVDDDYLGLSMAFPFPEGMAPAVGDLDGDGDADLLLGEGSGHIRYYENTAQAGAKANFVLQSLRLQDHNGDEIDAGGFSAPTLFDIDQDQDLDLFVGDLFGRLAYYQNIGTANNPSFLLQTPTWGKVKLSDNGYYWSGRTKPLFLDYDQDGTTELLLGGEEGYVAVYEDLTNPLVDSLIPDHMLFNFDFGAFAAPTAAILDTSGTYTFMVGMHRGGLSLFTAWQDIPPITKLPEGLDDIPFELYPNPAQSEVKLVLGERQGSVQVRVYNSLGQGIWQTQFDTQELNWSVEGYVPGIYYVAVYSKNQSTIRKLMVSP